VCRLIQSSFMGLANRMTHEQEQIRTLIQRLLTMIGLRSYVLGRIDELKNPSRDVDVWSMYDHDQARRHHRVVRRYITALLDPDVIPVNMEKLRKLSVYRLQPGLKPDYRDLLAFKDATYVDESQRYLWCEATARCHDGDLYHDYNDYNITSQFVGSPLEIWLRSLMMRHLRNVVQHRLYVWGRIDQAHGKNKDVTLKTWQDVEQAVIRDHSENGAPLFEGGAMEVREAAPEPEFHHDDDDDDDASAQSEGAKTEDIKFELEKKTEDQDQGTFELKRAKSSI
jgi:hypothetical protein